MTARHIMPLVSLIQYSSGNGSKSAGEITELKKFGWKAVQRRTKLESKALCESFGRRSTRENIAQIRRRRLTQIKIHAQKKILHSPKTRKIGSAASTGISNFVLSLVEYHPLIITEPSYLQNAKTTKQRLWSSGTPGVPRNLIWHALLLTCSQFQ